jgi:hypothetical protein
MENANELKEKSKELLKEAKESEMGQEAIEFS